MSDNIRSVMKLICSFLKNTTAATPSKTPTLVNLSQMDIGKRPRQNFKSSCVTANKPKPIAIPNQIERSETRDEKRYISWRYKPGQRLTVRLPVARIENAIVVPNDAVAEEGSERYLFVENGDHFDRIPVAVLSQDSINAAIANDGQVWPGQSIAISGAHQLQMALKNKSGGAIDPHAGHNH